MSRHLRFAGLVAVVSSLWSAGPSRAELPDGGAGPVPSMIAQLRELRAYPHLDRAYRLLERGRPVEARAEFERHLTLDPGNLSARTAYVVLLARLADYRAVATQADELIQRDASILTGWLYRAVARLTLGRVADAINDFQHVADDERAPAADRTYALGAIADAALGRRDYDRAHAALSAFAAEKRDRRWYLREGTALDGLQRFDAAFQAYLSAAGLATNTPDRLHAYKAAAYAGQRAGRWADARTALVAAIEVAPQDASVLQALADGAEHARDHGDAVRWMHRLVDEQPTAARRMSLARLLLAAGNPSEAAEQFASAARLATAAHDRHQALVGAARANDTLHRYVIAADLYERAAAVEPNADTLAALGQALESSGRPADALQALKRAWQRRPRAEYALRIGLLELKLERRDEAIRDLMAAASGDLPQRDKALAFRQLGLLYNQSGDHARAADYLHRALVADRRDDNSLAALGDAYVAQGQPGAAIQALTAGGQRPTPDVQRALARAHAANGDFNNAAAIYRALAVPADPRAGYADLMALGHAEFARGDLDAAVTAFRAAERRTPGDTAAPSAAAEALFAGGKWLEAAAVLRTLAERGNTTPDQRAQAYERLGFAYQRAGDGGNAIAAFQQALELGLDTMVVHQNLGFAFAEARRWREAVTAFRAALDRGASATVRISMARCYAELGQPGLALDVLKDATGESAAAGDRQPALSLAAFLYAQEGNDEDAVTAAEASLRLAFDVPTAIVLAAANRRLGRLAAATDVLDQVERQVIPPDSMLPYLDERAAVLVAEGRCVQATARLELAQRLEPSPARAYQLGRCAADRQQTARALLHFETASAAEPANPEYRQALGYALRRANRLDQAADAFQSVIQLDPDYLGVYEELGYLSLQSRQPAAAADWFRRALDNANLYPVHSVDQRASVDARLYRMRRETLALTSRWDVNGYWSFRVDRHDALRAAAIDGGALPASGAFDVSYRLGGPADRLSWLQLFGRVRSDSIESGGSLRTNSGALSAGARARPFRTLNFTISAERAIGDTASAPWLFRTIASRDRGFELRPGLRRWPYALLLGDAVWQPGGSAYSAGYGEMRGGMTFNLLDRWLMSPHAVADARLMRLGILTGQSVEAGPGLSVKYLFNASRYTTYRAMIETLISYRQSLHSNAAVEQPSGWVVTSQVKF